MVHKFKAKDSEIVPNPLCLGNISKYWSADNMEKTRFNGYVYDFSVYYDATDATDATISLSCISMKNRKKC